MLSVAVIYLGKIIAYYGDRSLEREILKLAPINGLKTEQKISNSLTFSFYCTQSMVFACVTQQHADQSKPLQFLDEIARRFSSIIGTRIYSATQHSLDMEFAKLFGKSINDFGTQFSKTQEIKNRLDETQKVLQNSVVMATERGDSLSLIQSKTEDLNAASEEFLSQSQALKRKMKCSWIKSNIAKVCIILAVLYLLISFICGGLDLAPRCRSKSE